MLSVCEGCTCTYLQQIREPDSKGAKSLMIFDTQTDQVVGNHVYDVKTEPKTGQVGKFETYSAEYVGTGQY
jgi:hypothetical protein